MTGDFRVDLAWLEQLIARLNTSSDTATSALRSLHETGPIRTGHKSLDKACDSFQKDCSDAMKAAREQISALSSGVTAAKNRYGGTEQAVALALTPEAGAGTTAPGSAAVPQTSIQQVLG